MSATGLMLVYSLNTWLPELMLRAGFNARGSLSFLMVLNGGAVVGALIGSKVADRFGAKLVVAATWSTAVSAMAAFTRRGFSDAGPLRARGLGAGPAYENLVRGKPRGGRGAVWEGATYGDLKVADGSAIVAAGPEGGRCGRRE